MKKSLNEKINSYCNSTEYPYAIYYTDIVPDARYKGYKYFFKYHGTHKVVEAFKTQSELENYIDSKCRANE